MPEFILNRDYTNGKNRHAYYGLDEFARGYVEAMFFTNGDTGSDDESALNGLGVGRLTKAAVAKISADCKRFTGTLMPDGCFARQWIDRLTAAEVAPRYGDGISDDRRAGHMFWYARQGHGVAWTDDYATDQPGYAIAEGLQDAARAFGESYVELHRGWIHVS